MRIKINERNLAIGITSIAAATFILLTSTLVKNPVVVSEIGIVLVVAALALTCFGVYTLVRAIRKA